MPAFQVVDWGPSQASKQAANFGQGFSESLKRGREQARQTDLLEQILNPEQKQQSGNPINAPNANQGPSYLGGNQQAPDNITPLLNNVSQHPDNLASNGVVSGPNPQSSKVNRITPEKMAKIEIIAPEVAKALKPVYESQTAKEKEGLKGDVKRSTEFLSKIDQIRDGLARKELSLRQIDDAVANRSSLDFLGDQLADITGLDSLRSAKGSQLLSATKEFFLSDLSSIPGVRANQFLERALSSAFTDPHRKQEANEMVAAGMRSNLQLDKVKTALTGQIEDHYRQTLGYIPASISKDVNNALTPYAQQIQDQWANEVQHITEKHDSKIQNFRNIVSNPKSAPSQIKHAASQVKLKQAIPGSILDDTMGLLLLEKYGDDEGKAMEAAKKLGYSIPGSK